MASINLNENLHVLRGLAIAKKRKAALFSFYASLELSPHCLRKLAFHVFQIGLGAIWKLNLRL